MENKVSEKVIKAAVKEARAGLIKNIMVSAIIDMGDNAPLLLKRKYPLKQLTRYELPCGLVKGREKITTALCRVVFEKTGLEVESIESYVNVYKFDIEDRYDEWRVKKEGYLAYRKRRASQIIFIVKVKPGGTVTLSDDHVGYVAYPTTSTEYMGLGIPMVLRWTLAEVFGEEQSEEALKIAEEYALPSE